MQEIKTFKLGVEEAKDLAIEHFLDWYTAGVIKYRQDQKSFANKMLHIKKSLKHTEFNELIFKPLLQNLGYEICYSNIHTRVGFANALTVDMLVSKSDNKLFFVEIKGVYSSPSVERVKAVFGQANSQLDENFEKRGNKLDEMELSDVGSHNINSFNLAGISCVSATVDSNHPSFPKVNKHHAVYAELDIMASHTIWKKEVNNE